MTKEELTPKEVSEIEKFLSTPGMTNLINVMKEPEKRVGRRNFFRKAAVDAYLDFNRENEKLISQGQDPLPLEDKKLVLAENGMVKTKHAIKKETKNRIEVENESIRAANDIMQSFDR